MKDEEVLAMYYCSDPDAFLMAELMYGDYMRYIAMNILHDKRDVEECVYDVLYTAWQTVHDVKPKRLGAYLARLTRNIALNKYRSSHVKKRGGGMPELAFEAVSEIASPNGNPEEEAEYHELAEAVSDFISTLPEEKREMFIDFLWYFEKPSTIAKKYGKSRNNVSTQMKRLLKRLQDYLIERGFYQ